VHAFWPHGLGRTTSQLNRASRVRNEQGAPLAVAMLMLIVKAIEVSLGH
jgi:hypothetical protein